MSSYKIVKNTVFLFVQMAFRLCLGVFSTRYILDALGVENFGIYAVIGGIIGFLTFLNDSMANAVQRFLSYHKKDAQNGILSKVFCSSFVLHLLMGLFLIVALEILSVFLFDELNIDPLRIGSAKIVLQCMVASVFLPSFLCHTVQALTPMKILFF